MRVGHTSFRVLIITLVHALCCWLFAGLATSRSFQIFPRTHTLTVIEQTKKIVPFAIFGAASIGTGNLALVYLYPSFHEMIQNTTPFWTLLVMAIFGGKVYNRWSYLSMIPVCGGGILCGIGEMNFHLGGTARATQ